MRTLQDIYVDIGRLLEEAYVLGKNETVLRVTTILNATVSVQKYNQADTGNCEAYAHSVDQRATWSNTRRVDQADWVQI